MQFKEEVKEEKHAWNSVSFGDVHDEAGHTGKGTAMQGFVVQVSILVFFSYRKHNEKPCQGFKQRNETRNTTSVLNVNLVTE